MSTVVGLVKLNPYVLCADNRYGTRHREMFSAAIRGRMRESGVHRHQRAI